jgi:lipid-A-disaccharide synthase-like uncharacterized protein
MPVQQYWSALLAATFLISLVLVGRKNPWGWALGILGEVLWVVYAVSTRQCAFIVSAAAYAAICLRNLRAWRRHATADRHPGADTVR